MTRCLKAREVLKRCAGGVQGGPRAEGLHLEVKFKATGSEFAPQLRPDGSADRTAYLGARLLLHAVR